MAKPISILLLLLLILMCTPVLASDDWPTEEWLFLPRHTYRLITSPLAWETQAWATFFSIMGATYALYKFDEPIQNWIQDNRTGVTEGIASFVRPLGDLHFSLVPLSAIYLYGVGFDSSRAQDTAVLAAESIFFTTIINGTIKVLAGRERPLNGNHPYSFQGPSLSDRNHSFPSGHTGVAFALATVFAEQYKEVSLLKPLVYATASLVALSRVHDNMHWPSDILFAAALGHFTAKSVLNIHKEDQKFKHFFHLAGDEIGLGFSLSF